ncbi:hypothetical protein BCR32DRAFT_284529 [Anaeromyces robustus]|uniref:Uncharacterized protein n=1 Tax=Anaeromyces robustus TaxID=1754192 RepID=A0A1Y1WRG0_9FUNG|nr:hypothetical protein BCR32DRAFT_284529 [Anaeromyces robustus]|eukprot:ORX76120.1 hypothetical protein BCR32DRAFT_284529 [Anaeromyces robustus]
MDLELRAYIEQQNLKIQQYEEQQIKEQLMYCCELFRTFYPEEIRLKRGEYQTAHEAQELEEWALRGEAVSDDLLGALQTNPVQPHQVNQNIQTKRPPGLSEPITSLVKHKIKHEIRRSSVPFDLKPKRLYDEISPEMGFQCCQYKTIKSSIARNISKQFPPDLKLFDEILDVSEYYKTIEGKEFKIFKNDNLIIFQSPFQAEFFSKYEDIFADGTWDFLYCTCNSSSMFPNINIKYRIWHHKRALDNKFNKLCSKKCNEHNYVQFLEFLEYFKYTYLIDYNIKYWNYYNNIKHITNNASESYNNQLKNFFSKKPTFFKLIYVLQKQQFLSNVDYKRRITGFWGKRTKKLIRTDEINTIVKYYKIMEILEKRKNEIDRNKITDLWLNCLDDLNIKIIN